MVVRGRRLTKALLTSTQPARAIVNMGTEIAVGRAREAFEAPEIQPLFLGVARG